MRSRFGPTPLPTLLRPEIRSPTQFGAGRHGLACFPLPSFQKRLCPYCRSVAYNSARAREQEQREGDKVRPGSKAVPFEEQRPRLVSTNKRSFARAEVSYHSSPFRITAARQGENETVRSLQRIKPMRIEDLRCPSTSHSFRIIKSISYHRGVGG